MLTRLSKLLVVLALALSLGLHWALLQSVAWVGMVVTYSRSAPLKEALAKTFDGKHPCNICKLVRDGHKSERKQEAQKQVAPLDGLCVPARVVIFPPEKEPQAFAPACMADTRSLPPPVPPPRELQS